MRNKYGGYCYRCGKWVEKGEGHFEMHKGKWRVQHVECCLEHREKQEGVIMNMVRLAEIEEVCGNADFGPILKFDVVKFALLKCAADYHQGRTSRQIITELGLITKGYKLTRRGRFCLYEFFKGNSTP